MAKALHQFIEFQRIYGEDSDKIIQKQLRPLRYFTTQMKDYKKAIIQGYEDKFEFFTKKLVEFYNIMPEEFQECVSEEFNHLLHLYLKKKSSEEKKEWTKYKEIFYKEIKKGNYLKTLKWIINKAFAGTKCFAIMGMFYILAQINAMQPYLENTFLWSLFSKGIVGTISESVTSSVVDPVRENISWATNIAYEGMNALMTPSYYLSFLPTSVTNYLGYDSLSNVASNIPQQSITVSRHDYLSILQKFLIYIDQISNKDKEIYVLMINLFFIIIILFTCITGSQGLDLINSMFGKPKSKLEYESRKYFSKILGSAGILFLTFSSNIIVRLAQVSINFLVFGFIVYHVIMGLNIYHTTTLQDVRFTSNKRIDDRGKKFLKLMDV